MLAELTSAILEKLSLEGLDTSEISFKDLIDKTINLTRPAVNIVVNQAGYEKCSMQSWKAKVVVSLIVVFQNLQGGRLGEQRRKEGIYKLIESIVNILLLERLDLRLENPLMPSGVRNITSADYARAGVQMYELTFTCSYLVSKVIEEDMGTIKSIMAQYFLEPNNHPAQNDLINLE
jgi:hypothetical protein